MLRPMLPLIAALSLSSAGFAYDTFPAGFSQPVQIDSESSTETVDFSFPAGFYRAGTQYLVATFSGTNLSELEITSNIPEENYSISVEDDKIFLILLCDVEVEA